MAQKGFLINSAECTGCKACELACKDVHSFEIGPRARIVREVCGGGWTVDEKTGACTPAQVFSYSVSYSCGHCEVAPCVEVCPTGATYKREDGIVVINKEECIGCESFVGACPYQARSKAASEDGYFGAELNEYEELMYPVMPAGAVDKCTFCAERIDAGDGQVQACVAACPAGARVFGDLDELRSQAEGAGGYQLLPEEGTNPSVWYLPFNVNE